ncbi:MAG: sugar ABC transporter substrate-binding protein, partial [Thermoflavifilum sp.]|nr:sugar ABC transporter substrate-binding protein [Thermoflavifilum sp.]MCL6515111.1 sugar ABC transporter substrate-binding protein [Alicyclobacillus sp.]
MTLWDDHAALEAERARGIKMKAISRIGTLTTLAAAGSMLMISVPEASASKSSQLPPQTIRFWEPDIASWQPLYKQLVDAFEKTHPTITVKLVNIPQSGFTQKLNTAFASGQGPDVFCWFYSRDMYAKGFIQPLDSYIKRDHWNMNQYFQPITNLRTKGLDGHYYGLPRDVSIDTVFYNKNLFDKYHVPYPKPGWTWADFERIAKELTHPKDNVYGTDMTSSDWWLEGYPWVWDYGSDMISEDGWNVQGKLDSKGVIKATEFAQKMAKDGSVVPSSLAQTFGSGDYADLLSGKVGMVQGTLWG